jgi:predicted ABC-class ATPase
MKELKDFPGYYITEDGRVFSTKYNKLKELTKQENKGYWAIYLEKDRKQYRKSIHRLVAETYIPNPDNLPQVNHIDEDKKNNHISNLEWVTQQQNLIHSNCRWIYKVENIITGEIFETINLNEFAKHNNISRRALSVTLIGKRNHHKNFRVISKTQFK